MEGIPPLVPSRVSRSTMVEFELRTFPFLSEFRTNSLRAEITDKAIHTHNKTMRTRQVHINHKLNVQDTPNSHPATADMEEDTEMEMNMK